VNQRVALVTGANGGIGQAVVARLRRDGFDVITSDLEGDVDLKLDIVNDELPTDVFGRVDVCVSNAGVVDTAASAHRISDNAWQRDLTVNLTGAFRVMQACLPGMRERRYGRLVAVSSLAANGMAGKVSYAASKAGLQGAVKTIAIENVNLGITANCIQPGFVDTPKVRAMPQSARDRLIDAIPMHRFGRPDEMADLIAFLAAESSGYITGQDIAIDGGLGLPTLALGQGIRETQP
jgi:NAD(P)-dependent dehydrogenase (short-subunit alcohol dehydrogenase family)